MTEAQKHCTIGFNDSDVKKFTMTNSDIQQYFHMARLGQLPSDFDRLDLRDANGFTVAHEAAENEKLPKDFNLWHLADKDGTTVAHIAASHLHLPKDFNQWDLADHKGWTVAHEFVCIRPLPPLPKDFNQWDLADHRGRTVAQVAALDRHSLANLG